MCFWRFSILRYFFCRTRRIQHGHHRLSSLLAYMVTGNGDHGKTGHTEDTPPHLAKKLSDIAFLTQIIGYLLLVIDKHSFQ